MSCDGFCDCFMLGAAHAKQGVGPFFKKRANADVTIIVEDYCQCYLDGNFIEDSQFADLSPDELGGPRTCKTRHRDIHSMQRR